MLKCVLGISPFLASLDFIHSSLWTGLLSPRHLHGTQLHILVVNIIECEFSNLSFETSSLFPLTVFFPGTGQSSWVYVMRVNQLSYDRLLTNSSLMCPEVIFLHLYEWCFQKSTESQNYEEFNNTIWRLALKTCIYCVPRLKDCRNTLSGIFLDVSKLYYH